MLLLITGSADGTADRLVYKFGEEVFRLNFDILSEYSIEFTEDYWRITNPSGLVITSDSVSGAFWWKAFSYWNPDLPKYPSAEAKYLCRDLYGWCALNNKAIGNPPDFHNRYGKMSILGVAKRFFPVPKTLTSMKMLGKERLADKRVVAKSLSSESSEDKKVLYTTEVDIERLHPDYTWYLQEIIESSWDITVFYCNRRCFAFKRDRSGLDGLDWRAEQVLDYSKQEWFPYDFPVSAQNSLLALSSELNIEFGRYDFMLTQDDELLFLELNANGQWVFLDIEDKYFLLDTVVDWLKSRAIG